MLHIILYLVVYLISQANNKQRLCSHLFTPWASSLSGGETSSINLLWQNLLSVERFIRVDLKANLLPPLTTLVGSPRLEGAAQEVCHEMSVSRRGWESGLDFCIAGWDDWAVSVWTKNCQYEDTWYATRKILGIIKIYVIIIINSSMMYALCMYLFWGWMPTLRQNVWNFTFNWNSFYLYYFLTFLSLLFCFQPMQYHNIIDCGKVTVNRAPYIPGWTIFWLRGKNS